MFEEKYLMKQLLGFQMLFMICYDYLKNIIVLVNNVKAPRNIKYKKYNSIYKI
jgi:hypothetical protein